MDRPSPRPTSLWRVRSAAGEAVSVIRVRNLQSTVKIGADAWGRHGKVQPILVSAEVSLREPFATSSARDDVREDTIHYGLLSKAILAALESANAIAEEGDCRPLEASLWALLHHIWSSLTGFRMDDEVDPMLEGCGFLPLQRMRSLSVTVHLPKATLAGQGVSLMGMSTFDPDGWLYCVCFRLHRLQIPTLIGVNENERMGKQAVIADLEIENYNLISDAHFLLEKAIHEAMAQSSFATLEALALCLYEVVKGKFPDVNAGWQIRIKLEKPVAVPLAEGAVVEFMSPVKTT